MASTSILRKSVNSFAPLAIRLIRVQRNYHPTIFTALNHGLQSQEPAVNHFYSNTLHFSTVVAAKKPSSTESLIRVLESEIQCAEEGDESDQSEHGLSQVPNEKRKLVSRSYKKRSPAWDHFEEIKDSSGKRVAGRCKYCGIELKSVVRNVTRAFNKHYSKCESQVSKKGKRKLVSRNRKTKSPVWEHFEEIKDSSGIRAVGRCKYCGIEYTINHGTGNLIRHYLICEKNPSNISKQSQTRLVLERDANNEGEANLKKWVYFKLVSRNCKTRSPVWDHFEEIKDSSGKRVAGRCKYCGIECKAAVKNVTRTFIRHYWKCESRIPNEGERRLASGSYKTRSHLWEHFEEIKDSSSKRVAGRCKYCGIECTLKYGTEYLNRHYLKCEKNPSSKSKQSQTRLVLEKDVNNVEEANLKKWVYFKF